MTTKKRQRQPLDDSQQSDGQFDPRSFRRRIVGLRNVPASELVPNPKNIHRHGREQKQILESLMRSIGIAGAELTRTLPDGRLMLIDGHLRQDIVGDELIPVLETDLTEDESDQILATYDPIQRLAIYDQQNAAELSAILARSNPDASALLAAASQQDAGLDLMRQYEEQQKALLGTPWSPNGAQRDDGDPYPDTISWESSEEDEDEPPTASTLPAVYDQDAILDAALAYYRATYGADGFPYRHLPVFVAMQRLNQLARTPTDQLTRTTVGVDIADSYHPHRYHARVPGQNSPYQSFHEDKLLRQALKLRYEDAGRLHEGYQTTLNVVNHTQAVSNFRPGFAAYIYRTYAKPGAVVLDTSTGYGGRLVGYLASGLIASDPDSDTRTGRYIGIDPNTETHAGNLKLAADFGFHDCIELHCVPAEDFDAAPIANTCDLAFTSPPYFARERYSEEETQSWKRYGPDKDKTGNLWRERFLRPTLALQFTALKPGAYTIININDVEIGKQSYPLVSWTMQDAIAAGFEYVETLHFDLNTSFGLGHDHDAETAEPTLVFRKPTAPQRPTSASYAVAALDDDVATRNTSPEPRDVARMRVRAQTTPDSPLSLSDWMWRLYSLSRDEQWLHGDLGVWPVELGEYIRRLCLAYSSAPVRFSLQEHLLQPSPKITERPNIAGLLFSGGKDSIAAGMAAQVAGYEVWAIHLQRVNHSYPQEEEHARQIAKSLGWRFVSIRPSKTLPPTLGESFIKNQFCMALVADTLAARDELPGALITGSYRIDDCHVTNWYSDMAVAYHTFDEALGAATHRATQHIHMLAHHREAIEIWHTQVDDATREHTASCMMPLRNKPQHRERNLAAGVPLLPYDCGSCEKCYLRAVVLADVLHTTLRDDGICYPDPYLKRARKRLSSLISSPLWAQGDPDLESLAYPNGASATAYLHEVFADTLAIAPRRNTSHGATIDITYP